MEGNRDGGEQRGMEGNPIHVYMHIPHTCMVKSSPQSVINPPKVR